MTVADCEISALDEGKAKMAREVGMFEISLVVWPGREENNIRVIVSRRREMEKHVALLTKEVAQALNVALADFLWKNP